MKIAYLILAHNNPQQLYNLVNVLNVDNTFFYIHIDKKVNIENFTSLFNKNNSNISFITNRENGQWGDFGIVKATITLLKEAIKNDCDYYILLSGMDYPIKSNPKIFSFLESNFGKSFIEYSKLPLLSLNYGGLNRTEGHSYTIGKTRYTYIPYYLKPKYNFKGHVLNVLLGCYSIFKGKRKKPKGIVDFYYGSQWWMLYKNDVEYIVKYIDENPNYLKYHEKTLLPDELFFQTILLNSLNIVDLNIINNNYRYIIWEENSNHPKSLNINDINSLKNTNSLFARKFNFENDIKLLNHIDIHLINTYES